jgi:hypothetical protein
LGLNELGDRVIGRFSEDEPVEKGVAKHQWRWQTDGAMKKDTTTIDRLVVVVL